MRYFKTFIIYFFVLWTLRFLIDASSYDAPWDFIITVTAGVGLLLSLEALINKVSSEREEKKKVLPRSRNSIPN